MALHSTEDFIALLVAHEGRVVVLSAPTVVGARHGRETAPGRVAGCDSLAPSERCGWTRPRRGCREKRAARCSVAAVNGWLARGSLFPGPHLRVILQWGES
eukprot:scaffold81554_cov33-Tisochrysis_lutea.AAC.2